MPMSCKLTLVAPVLLLLACSDDTRPAADARPDQKIVQTDGRPEGPAADRRRPDGRAVDAELAPEAGKPDSTTGGDGSAATACGPTLKCLTATEICVVMAEELGWTYSCKPVPAGCETDRTCACAGKTLCTGAFNLCVSGSSNNTITCECPAC